MNATVIFVTEQLKYKFAEQEIFLMLRKVKLN